MTKKAEPKGETTLLNTIGSAVCNGAQYSTDVYYWVKEVVIDEARQYWLYVFGGARTIYGGRDGDWDVAKREWVKLTPLEAREQVQEMTAFRTEYDCYPYPTWSTRFSLSEVELLLQPGKGDQ
jgi:hypothetical protein